VDKGWLAVRTCAGIAGEGRQVVDSSRRLVSRAGHDQLQFKANRFSRGAVNERRAAGNNQSDGRGELRQRTISSFEDFDDDEPLTAGARDIFRHELVPEFKSLVARLLQYELYQEVRDVCSLWSCFHGIIIENSHLGDGILLQLSDLPEDFRSWKPE
jgi:hypothetical protein